MFLGFRNDLEDSCYLTEMNHRNEYFFYIKILSYEYKRELNQANNQLSLFVL